MTGKIRPNDPPTVTVEGLSVEPTATTLNVGETQSLKVVVSPDNATEKRVSYSSSDASIATVRNGTITAVAPGETTVSVTSRGNSDLIEIVSVTVNEETEPETGDDEEE